MAPDFWNDPKEAEKVMKEIKSHKNWVEQQSHVEEKVGDLEVLYEFFKEGEGTEQEVDNKYDEALKSIEDLEFR
ncbi:MAG: PCRF domain-containing protein, partial [Saprospiraceae bacterium]|nr:PCRF domain-containing protein [Saprospiraceae bacterium]